MAVIDKIDKWILTYIKNRGAFIEPLRKIGYEATAKITALGEERDGWHKVVVECEEILGCKDTAESPLMSNLPNLVRDLKNRESEIIEALKESDNDDDEKDNDDISARFLDKYGRGNRRG